MKKINVRGTLTPHNDDIFEIFITAKMGVTNVKGQKIKKELIKPTGFI